MAKTPETDLELDPPRDPQLDDQTVIGDPPDEESDVDDQEPEGEQGGDDEEVLETQQPEQRQQRQPGRYERRVSSQQARIQELDQEKQALARKLDDITRQLGSLSQPQQAVETPEQRATRHALLTPEERITEQLREAETRHTQVLNVMQFNMVDTADKTAFVAKAASDPLYAKWAPIVETKLTEMRNHPDPRQRSNVAREALFYYLVGEAAIKARKEKGPSVQRQQAEKRVAAQRGSPVNSRGDSPTNRSRQTSLEKRLENVSI